jgi:predicted phosphohydrolase
MKFRLVSDIHQEFFLHSKTADFWVPEPLEDDKNTVLIIAGDFALVKHQSTLKFLLEDLCKQFYSVVYVLGNHEYWKGCLLRAVPKLEACTDHLKNLYILENDTVVFGDTVVIGCTLWSDIDYFAAQYMHDYTAIRYSTDNPRRINMMDTITLHVESVNYIADAIQCYKHLNKVVVTHFSPSEKSVASYFDNSTVNSAYFSNLEHMVDQVDVWCHGHMHNSSDYMVGDGRVICNPRGYLDSENPEFKENLVFEV